jgi:predicted flap endonuclease-1-like 5' DNA nuclease
MNPLLWWWRWWSRVISPNRDEAEELIEQQREKADRLSSELEAKDAEIAALQQRLGQSDSEVEGLQTRLSQAERAEPAPKATPEPEATPDGAPPGPQVQPDRAAPEPVDETPPDVSTATQILGTRIKLDDLTVIEGIGPKIADLLSNAGFSTWRALSGADPADLRRVLQEAGPRYRVHDPSKWPPQAGLLAQGRWQEYKDMTAKARNRTS